MGKFLLFFGLFISNIAFSQISDNFSDGNFTQNPAWQGDVNAYFINGSQQLQTANTAINQTVNLYTNNSLAINARWEFYIKLGFDPTAGNQVRIYLVSDQADLNGPLNGYFLQIGETGSSDSYDLYRQSGTTITRIIDGPAKIRSNVNELKARIQITRNSAGLWELKTDIEGGTNYISEGTATDNTFTSSNFFGIKSIYTSSRSNLFFYDDFSITELILDTNPPIFNSVSTTDGTNITLNFDEVVDVTDATNISNYSLNPGNIQPKNVTVSGAQVILYLASQLNTGNHTITINTIKDLKGNTASALSKTFFYRKPYIAKANDIVINEIFADPNPQVDLPSVEFIEIWNRSLEDIAVKDFKYKDATTTFTFGKDSIKANEYIILCAKADTLEFKNFGKTMGLSPWPSLNNSGDQLSLINQNGTIIHQVNYSDTWYKDATKKNGGYSLELIDPLSLCKQSQNYSASTAIAGGTPGRQNSIYLANKISDPLILLSVSLEDSVTVSLNFNRGLDSLQASLTSQYQINNGVGFPLSATCIAPKYTSLILKYLNPLNRNSNYTIKVNGVTDCGAGVVNNQSLDFLYPGAIDKKDILINEILFNPRPSGVDFLEIYNNSDKTLDFKDLSLATLNDKDSLISIKNISKSALFFEPKTYWVLSTDPDNIKSEYQTVAPANFIKLPSMPSFNDDKGVAVLINNKMERVDQFNYTKQMHFGLLKEQEGVSLERSSFTDEANKKGNFRSATSSVGYATPAYKNSQYVDRIESEEAITLSSLTFSPDNDGFEDILTIAYNLEASNFVANVTIYDDNGRLIKKLISNETVSTRGQWNWDGLDLNNNKAKAGIYIIYIEFFNLNAEVKKFKKTVVVGSKI